MLRTRLGKAYIKRTFRPTYGWTQMTPKSVFLDPTWDRHVDVWPGMVFSRTSGENVTLTGGNSSGNPPGVLASSAPYGFGALYVGGDGVDEVLDSGINAFAVWVMGPDAEAELLAPAFDNTLTFTDPGDGSEALLYVSMSGANQGKVVPSGASNASAKPVARLLKVNSSTKITIGGLSASGAY